jgi:uncharacterized damage-inducible protein DinB
MLPFERPPRTANERGTLIAFLNAQRSIMLWKLAGLDREQAVESTVPSGTSLLGLVKHMAWVERFWFVDFIGGASLDYPWSDEDPDADFRIEADETIESVSMLYVRAIAEASQAIDTTVDLDVTGTSAAAGTRSLRWVLVHMIEETARHAGHADIIREQVDGTTGYTPPTE